MTEQAIAVILQRLNSIEDKIDDNKINLKEYIGSVSQKVDRFQQDNNQRLAAIEARLQKLEIEMAKDHVKTESTWNMREKVFFWMIVVLAGALLASIGVK